MWSFTISWPSLDVPCRKKSLNVVFRFSLAWNCNFSENFLFHPWFPPSDCASYWTAVEKQKQMPLWSFQWRGTDAYERDLKGGRGDSSMCTFSSILLYLGQRKACHARTVQVKYTPTHTQGPPCPCPLSPSFSVNNHCRRALVAMQQHKGRCRRGQRNRSRRLLSQRNASQAAIYAAPALHLECHVLSLHELKCKVIWSNAMYSNRRSFNKLHCIVPLGTSADQRMSISNIIL